MRRWRWRRQWRERRRMRRRKRRRERRRRRRIWWSPFDLPTTVQKLKLYFPSAASTAGVKPALEQMEREIYGEVKVGALNVRVRALSLEFGGMYTLSRST